MALKNSSRPSPAGASRGAIKGERAKAIAVGVTVPKVHCSQIIADAVASLDSALWLPDLRWVANPFRWSRRIRRNPTSGIGRKARACQA